MTSRGRDRLPKQPQRVRRALEIGGLTSSGVIDLSFNGDITLDYTIGLEDSGGSLVVHFLDGEVLPFGTDSDYGVGYYLASDELRIVDGTDLNANIRLKLDSSGNFDLVSGNLKTAGTGRFDAGIVDSSNWTVILPETRRLQKDATLVLDWDNQYLYDIGTVLSVNWNTRVLYADDGTDVVLDWSTVGLADFGNSTIKTTSLTASLGVYTDASQQLTSTPPSSGVLGYWDRTGTVLSPANAGDDIETTGRLGVGGSANADNNFRLTMAASDAVAMYIDGLTNDYTGTGSGVDLCLFFGRDLNAGDGNEPTNFTGFVADINPKHTLADVSTNGKTILGLHGLIDNIAAWRNTSGAQKTVGCYGTRGTVNNDGNYDSTGAGRIVASDIALLGSITANPTFTASGGATNILSTYGAFLNVDSTPTLSTGLLTVRNYGLYVDVDGTSTGSSTNYGIYIAGCSGADGNYAIWDASGANWYLDGDNQMIILGEGQDLQLFFDGSYGRLDATGDPIRIGDNTTNCLEIEPDGDIRQLGTGRFIESSKFKMTAIGGYAIKLTNKTGIASVAGQLVKADVATDDAVVLAGIGDVECFGVFLDAGIADGSETWVIVGGIADVAFDDNVAAVRGNWVATGAAAGYARTAASPAAAPQHFEEIGHCIESVAAGGGGTHILARCILHFN